MLRILILCLIPGLLLAEDRWSLFRSGPLEVVSNASDRQAREALTQIEQLRHTLGAVLSKKDMLSVFPIRIVVAKNGRASTTIELGRDAYTGSWPAGAPGPRHLIRDIARILLEVNATRMSPEIEHGLIDLYSTLDVKGTRVALGQPLPPAERTRDWARMHLLSVDPRYSGRLRVLLANLQQGSDPEPAYKNAFEKMPAEIEKELDAYLKAGTFGTTDLSGKPIAPDREFLAKPYEPPSLAKVWLADLDGTATAYQAVLKQHPDSKEAAEGLGLLAAKAKQTAEAKKYLDIAIKGDTKNARAWLEYGRLQDAKEGFITLQKAANLNPRWAEPHYRMAEIALDPVKALEEFKTAAKLEPRNFAYWQKLAEAQIEQKLFGDAAKSWMAAEHAAPTEEERARIRQQRAAIETQRLDFEAAEKRRKAEEERQEIERLKREALAEISKAEARINKNNPAPDPNRKVVPWWDGPQPSGKVTGTLQRVDCLGSKLRLAIHDGKRTVQLLIPDPQKLVLKGGGETNLGCGLQRPPRKIQVEYFPRPDAKLGTAGDAAVVEFP